MKEYQKLFPVVVVIVCYFLGSFIKKRPGIPDWVIAPTLVVTGVVMGAAEAVLMGETWEQAGLTIMKELLSGAGTVGLHQAYKQPSEEMKSRKAKKAAAAPASDVVPPVETPPSDSSAST